MKIEAPTPLDSLAGCTHRRRRGIRNADARGLPVQRSRHGCNRRSGAVTASGGTVARMQGCGLTLSSDDREDVIVLPSGTAKAVFLTACSRFRNSRRRGLPRCRCGMNAPVKIRSRTSPTRRHEVLVVRPVPSSSVRSRAPRRLTNHHRATAGNCSPQAVVDVDMLVRQDLARDMAQAVDSAAIQG